MLFRRAVLERIATGEVTLAFRRWRRPTVRAGGTLRTSAGLLAIESVDRVEGFAVTDDEARRAGFTSPAEVVEELARRSEGDCYRVAFRLAGPDPRHALRDDDSLADDDVEAMRSRLARLDRAARNGAWTLQALRLIEQHPGTRAADLAPALGAETPAFKRSVRKLKELGLTESLEVGYRLSPRGRALLDRLSG